MNTALDVRRAAAWFALVTALGCGSISMVEDMDGGLSYWALAHPSAKPDFHHINGFILSLERSDT